MNYREESPLPKLYIKDTLAGTNTVVFKDSMVPPCESDSGICDIDDLCIETDAQHLRKLANDCPHHYISKLVEFPSFIGLMDKFEGHARRGATECIIIINLNNTFAWKYAKFIDEAKEWCKKEGVEFEFNYLGNQECSFKFNWKEK